MLRVSSVEYSSSIMQLLLSTHTITTAVCSSNFAEIPTPRPRTGRVRAERTDIRRQTVPMRLVRTPAKKPRGKAVGGERDPLESAAPKGYEVS